MQPRNSLLSVRFGLTCFALMIHAVGSTLIAQETKEITKESVETSAERADGKLDSTKESAVQKRLAAIAEKYSSAKTYRDDGTLVQEIPVMGRKITSTLPFTTSMERGGRFYWQFQHSATPGAKPDQTYKIWSTDGNSFDSSWTLTGKQERGQKIDSPLAAATGISGGCATAIIPMLQVSNEGSHWGQFTTDLVEPIDLGQESVEGNACWKVEGKARFGDSKMTLWVDAEDLIRKIYTVTVVDMTKLPARAKRRVPVIPEFTTYSTITLRPFINEEKIDDTRFYREPAKPE